MHAAPIHSVLPLTLGALPASMRRIDVREPAEFEGMLGHLAGSELIPLATLCGAAELWPRSEPLLLICRSGARSMKAAWALAGLGFTSLYNLEGGMLAVNEAGLEVEGPSAGIRVSTGQARDALCAAVRELYGPVTPPPCESLFRGSAAFANPDRPKLLHALERLEARALADGLDMDTIDRTLRGMRDLMALVEPGKSLSS